MTNQVIAPKFGPGGLPGKSQQCLQYTLDEIATLRRVAEAATQKNWKWFTSNSNARLSCVESGKDGDIISASRAPDGVPCVSVSQEDMAFIETFNPAMIQRMLNSLEAKVLPAHLYGKDATRADLLANSELIDYCGVRIPDYGVGMDSQILAARGDELKVLHPDLAGWSATLIAEAEMYQAKHAQESQWVASLSLPDFIVYLAGFTPR
ncbi:hypothetical protein [Providencia sp. MGF014]|uniref:hypothetical protein n=1 Tax=Providencia sp. MGF014 TaxID=2565573 RepID=UPI00109CEB1D|nr:hypothetical protein E6R27_20460 [Providencia sp. MGF014]